MRRLAVLGLFAACGRLEFDPHPRDGTDAALPDVPAGVCGLPGSAPVTVAMSGTTLEYQSFDNAYVAVPGVRVRVIDADTLASVAETTSDAGGAYVVSAPTGGMPRRLGLQYEQAGFFVTNVVHDLPIAADAAGQGFMRWSFGDGPIWDMTAMNAIYAASSVTRDPARGFINVAVRDCAGEPIDGVEVAFDPAPGAVRYQAADGRPAVTGPTQLPFGHAFALNAVPGLTRITATKSGRTFLEQTVMVLGGAVNTLTLVRAID